MKALKEKINEEIIKTENSNPIITSFYYKSGKISALKWILSEIEKMTCENCKWEITCGEQYYDSLHYFKYCSEWEKGGKQ